MDLSLYDSKTLSEDGTWLIPLWNGEPLDCSILVLGPDSKESVKIQDEEMKEAQKRLVDSLTEQKKSKKDSIESESSEDKDVKKASNLIRDWKNIQWEGKDFPYNKKNAEFLMLHAAFLRDQVLRYHQNRANFTKSGSIS